jgi:hypothetical protein
VEVDVDRPSDEEIKKFEAEHGNPKGRVASEARPSSNPPNAVSGADPIAEKPVARPPWAQQRRQGERSSRSTGSTNQATGSAG